MKINELINGFTVFTSREEDAILKKLHTPAFLSEFTERDQVVINGLIRKSLVIKIGMNNSRVVANIPDSSS